MHRTAVLALLLCIGLHAHATCQENSALALEQALHQVGGAFELWPGYDPLSIPLAIFDGTNTFLFRHPAPPDGFVESEGAFVLGGRHPRIVANSSVTIGEVSTATVMLETLSEEGSPQERAALVAHEGFHVFQGTTARRWGANEVNLFTYPVDDVALLVLRRMETEALRRAFAAEETDDVREWAMCALRFRDERFALLDEASRSYERGIETMEGTATYVEYRVAARTQPPLPEDGCDAEDVRSRCYTTGVAWALLLDRFNPDWRDGFADSDSLFLDTAAAQALSEGGSSARPRAFTASEIAAIELAARADVERVVEKRVERRTEFESRPGWSVVVKADAAGPMWPQGFDPLNVHHVKDGILHTRFLKLGNDSGNLEVMGTASLTEGAGPHPLFNGVLSLTVTGLENEPEVEVIAGDVTVTSPDFNAEFMGAGVERQDERIVVLLPPPVSSGEGE